MSVIKKELHMNEELDFLLDEINVQEQQSQVFRVTIERKGRKTIVEMPDDNLMLDQIRHFLQSALLGSGMRSDEVKYIFEDLY